MQVSGAKERMPCLDNAEMLSFADSQIQVDVCLSLSSRPSAAAMDSPFPAPKVCKPKCLSREDRQHPGKRRLSC